MHGRKGKLAVQAILAVVVAASTSIGRAEAVPALDFRFDDYSGSTVPNHGSLGATGVGTLGAGTTIDLTGHPHGLGGSLIIDATADLMSTADIDSLDTLDEFTLSFFVKPVDDQSWRDIMGDCDHDPANAVRGWNLQGMSNGRVYLRFWHDSFGSMGGLYSADDIVVPNEWHHVTVVAKGLQQPGSHTIEVDFYSDGQHASTSSFTTTHQVGNDDQGFKIGDAIWDPPRSNAEYASVALFDTALTAGEVRAEYYRAVVPEPLLAYRFDDADGSTVPNHGSLGATGDGTLGSNTTVNAVGQPFGNGGSLVINQGGDVMSTADIDGIDALNGFTLSFFVKPTAGIVDWRDMMGDCDDEPQTDIDGWNVQSMNDGVVRLRLWDSVGGRIGDFDSDSDLLATDEWRHIMIAADHLMEAGTRTVTVDFYLDGELFSSSSKSTSRQVGSDTGGFKIGNAMWDGELLAEYADLALFGTALDADQARLYFNTLVPEPTTAALLLIGGLGLLLLGRRSQSRGLVAPAA